MLRRADTIPEGQPKFMIGTLSYRAVYPVAHASMMAMAVTCPNVTDLLCVLDTYLHCARNKIANEAIKAYRRGTATHLLWLDDDMIFPHYVETKREDGTSTKVHLAQKLWAHKQPVVSAVYYKADDAKPIIMDEECTFLNTVPTTGLIRAGVVGFGCVLMDIKVLVDMKKRYQDELFQMPLIPGLPVLDEEGNRKVDEDGVPVLGESRTIGEDLFFCRRLQEMGIPLHVDCDVQCGHVKLEVIDRVSHEATLDSQPEEAARAA